MHNCHEYEYFTYSMAQPRAKQIEEVKKKKKTNMIIFVRVYFAVHVLMWLVLNLGALYVLLIKLSFHYNPSRYGVVLLNVVKYACVMAQ